MPDLPPRAQAKGSSMTLALAVAAFATGAALIAAGWRAELRQRDSR